jgi:hypothetical protein
VYAESSSPGDFVKWRRGHDGLTSEKQQEDAMWHIRAILIIMAGALFVLAPEARADGLQLKNGNFVQGKYLGGTERAVQFEVNGRIRMYDIGEILSINFGSADGMPSSNVEPKASANRESHFAAGSQAGMHAAFWNARKSGKAAVERIAWGQEESRRSKLRAEPQSTCVTEMPNSERRTHEPENPGQVKGILRPRLAVIPD